jgi:hypothetical protein
MAQRHSSEAVSHSAGTLNTSQNTATGLCHKNPVHTYIHTHSSLQLKYITFLQYLCLPIDLFPRISKLKFVDFVFSCIPATCLNHHISFDLMVSSMLLLLLLLMMMIINMTTTTRRWWRWYGSVDMYEYLQKARTLNVVTGNDVIITMGNSNGVTVLFARMMWS